MDLVASQQRQSTAALIDAATKWQFHSKRTQLTVPDVRQASGGATALGGGGALPELLAVPDTDLLCRLEAELPTADVPTLPAAPWEAGVACHWLAVAGVQPATAENAQPRRAAAPSMPRTASRAGAAPATAVPHSQAPAGAGTSAGPQQGEGGGIIAGLPLRHSMPEELQLYYDIVRRTLQAPAGSGPLAVRAVAASLATDPGLQPVLPYLVPLLADETGKHLDDVEQLRVLLSAMRGVLSNNHLSLMPYIHHLLPAILTCLVARNLGQGDDHWAIRDEAAALLGQISQRSQQRKDELAPALGRVQQTLAGALFDDSPQTQYGSLVGLTVFGVPVLMSTVVPNLKRYSQLLQAENVSPDTLHVRAALMIALGRCMSWGDGCHAAAILKAADAAGFGTAVQAVAPSTAPHL